MNDEYDDIDEETIFEDDETFEDMGEISEGLLLASDVLPEQIPIIPLRPRPAFPNILIPMSISGKEKVDIIKKAADSQSRAIGMVLVRNIEGKDEPDNLHRIGVVGKIVKIMKSDEDNIQVLVNCLERFTIKSLHETEDGLSGSVEYLKTPEDVQREELKAYSMAIITTLKELVQINPLYSEEIKMFLGRSSMDDPGKRRSGASTGAGDLRRT
jgi:ATP-dependent Lon protease